MKLRLAMFLIVCLAVASCKSPVTPPPPPTEYTLTVAVSPSGGGTVAQSPSRSSIPSGWVATLTAIAASGFSFGSWSGDASGATNPATVTMNANKSVTANFALVWTIVVTQPTAGLTWYHRISYNILWTTTMNPAGLVKIELLKAGVVAVTITPSTANNGSYSWTVLNTLANGTNYQIKITSTTSSSISGTSPNFSIMKPTITVTQPAAGVAWSRGKPYNIIWTSPVLGSGTVKIDLYRGTVLNSTIISTTPNDGTHSWTISKLLTLANNYSVRITWLTDTSVFGTSGVFTIKR